MQKLVTYKLSPYCCAPSKWHTGFSQKGLFAHTRSLTSICQKGFFYQANAFAWKRHLRSMHAICIPRAMKKNQNTSPKGKGVNDHIHIYRPLFTPACGVWPKMILYPETIYQLLSLFHSYINAHTYMLVIAATGNKPWQFWAIIVANNANYLFPGTPNDNSCSRNGKPCWPNRNVRFLQQVCSAALA